MFLTRVKKWTLVITKVDFKKTHKHTGQDREPYYETGEDSKLEDKHNGAHRVLIFKATKFRDSKSPHLS